MLLLCAVAPAVATGLSATPTGTGLARSTFRAAPARAPAVRMMYSDSKPTIEYFDYLTNGEEFEDLDDMESIIVGGGRIGSLLYDRCGLEGDILLGRGDKIPEDFPGPIYVATRNDDLADIIEGCPESKRDDLIFLQNPMIEPLLKRYAMADTNTMVNVYFAVPTKGANPIDGITDVNPDGLTSVTGKWAKAVQQRLNRAELSCKLLHKRDCRRAMIEKHIWLSVFMVIGTAQGHISGKPLTVGEVERYFFKEVEPMCRQLGFTSRTLLSAAPPEGLEDRLRAYSRAVADFPTAMKEFRWRNGFWYDYSQLCISKGFDDPMPQHTEYVQYCLDNDLVSGM